MNNLTKITYWEKNYRMLELYTPGLELIFEGCKFIHL